MGLGCARDHCSWLSSWGQNSKIVAFEIELHNVDSSEPVHTSYQSAGCGSPRTYLEKSLILNTLLMDPLTIQAMQKNKAMADPVHRCTDGTSNHGEVTGPHWKAGLPHYVISLYQVLVSFLSHIFYFVWREGEMHATAHLWKSEDDYYLVSICILSWAWWHIPIILGLRIQ